MPTNVGEALRDHGCHLADAVSKRKSLQLRIDILTVAIFGKPFSADDLPGSDLELRSNGTGAGFLALSKKGLIVFTGQCLRSTRPNRHAGMSRLWRATELESCRELLARLQQELSLIDPAPTQGELFGGDEL